MKLPDLRGRYRGGRGASPIVLPELVVPMATPMDSLWSLDGGDKWLRLGGQKYTAAWLNRGIINISHGIVHIGNVNHPARSFYVSDIHVRLAPAAGRHVAMDFTALDVDRWHERDQAGQGGYIVEVECVQKPAWNTLELPDATVPSRLGVVCVRLQACSEPTHVKHSDSTAWRLTFSSRWTAGAAVAWDGQEDVHD